MEVGVEVSGRGGESEWKGVGESEWKGGWSEWGWKGGWR